MEQDCSFRNQNSALLDDQGIHLHFTGRPGDTWRLKIRASLGVAYVFLEIYQQIFHNLCTSTYIRIHVPFATLGICGDNCKKLQKFSFAKHVDLFL